MSQYGNFIILALVMLTMWFSILGFFYLKADEITKDPCSICAKRVGNDYLCMPKTIGESVTFYENGSISSNINEIKQQQMQIKDQEFKDLEDINVSKLLVNK